MKLLFVCKFNCFRSLVAKKFFDKLNKNKNIEARASGFIIPRNYSREQQQKAVEEFGIKLDEEPEIMDENLYKWPDKIVIVGNDVPKEIFDILDEDNSKMKKRNVEVWKLNDVGQKDLSYQEKTRMLTQQILNSVKSFINELEKEAK